MLERPSWNTYFMHLAEETALRSKDPNTKVGACLVKDKRVMSLGYNGAPRSFDDLLVPSSSDSNLPLIQNKNTFMVHAELNSILNFRGNLAELNDSILYVTISPCFECAKILAQLGVKKIIYKERYHREECSMVAEYILRKCGVELIQFDKLEKEE